jgi:hypothetical protein
VVDGAVTLRGTVDTAEAKSEAERITKETDGVKKVTNQLKVAPSGEADSAKPATEETVESEIRTLKAWKRFEKPI